MATIRDRSSKLLSRYRCLGCICHCMSNTIMINEVEILNFNKRVHLEDKITQLENINEMVDLIKGIDMKDVMLNLELDFKKLEELKRELEVVWFENFITTNKCVCI